MEKIVVIEREFSKIFDGGCHTPMGCHCILNGDKITLTGVYFKGETGYSASITEDAALGIKIAQKLADIIKEKIND
jgi:hydroxymethylbilane synthase